MRDEYVNAFRRVIQQTRKETGIELPLPVETYVVMLLASKMSDTRFIPEQSFLQTHLEIHDSRSAKELGDNCLFLTGVFPTYGARFNVDRTYYVSIGASSYGRAAQTLNYQVFELLSVHFDYVRAFVEASASIRSGSDQKTLPKW